MGLHELANLARVGKLKIEPRNESESRRMLVLAQGRLADAGVPGISLEGRFTSAYNASHAAALAALRWHGYRSENRYIVFQCLTHTLGWPASQWRVLDMAHQKRNLAEYEGDFDLDPEAVDELCAMAQRLISDVQGLVAS